MIIVMLKNREDLENLPMTQVFGILKGNELSVLNESGRNVAGSLALVGKDVDSDDDDDEVSDDDQRKLKAFIAVNPGTKKFFKKKFNNKFRKSNTNSSSSNKDVSVSSESTPKSKELVKDSGYDCYECGEKNHLAKDCMWRKQQELKA